MLGDDYSGAWLDETQLAVTITIAGQRPPEIGLAYGWLRGASVPGATRLRNSLGLSAPSTASTPLLSGDFGQRPTVSVASPQLVPAAGGTALTVFGAGFTSHVLTPSDTRCVWTLSPALPSPPSNASEQCEPAAVSGPPAPPPPAQTDVVSLAHDRLLCQVPPAAGSPNASLLVQLTGGRTFGPFYLSYYAQATVSLVLPVAGPWRGGTPITLAGAFSDALLDSST